MRRDAGHLSIAAGDDADLVRAVYLAVASGQESAERIFTILGPAGERIPLVALDDKGLEILRAFSQESADASGETVSIICFTQRSLHEIFRPYATGDTRP